MNVHFEPLDEYSAEPCRVIDVSTCNITGDDVMDAMCLHGFTSPIITRLANMDKTLLTSPNKIYKNIACVLCNIDGKIENIETTCRYRNLTTSQYKAIVNIPDFWLNNQIQTEKVNNNDVNMVDQGHILTQIKSRDCPRGSRMVLVSGYFCQSHTNVWLCFYIISSTVITSLREKVAGRFSDYQ